MFVVNLVEGFLMGVVVKCYCLVGAEETSAVFAVVFEHTLAGAVVLACRDWGKAFPIISSVVVWMCPVQVAVVPESA